jgi:uncharacterized protein YjbI with pentapeptide repeats
MNTSPCSDGGAAAWNAWRAERDVLPDLSRAGLRGLDLSEFNLSRTDLQGADLRGTNLSQAKPIGCQFGGGEPFQSGAADPMVPTYLELASMERSF